MKTTILNLAAALISLGANLEDVDKSDPRHMVFILSYSMPFAPEEEWFDGRKAMWDDGNLPVNSVTFVKAQERLKREVHSA